VYLVGSGRESVTPPDFMSVLVFANSEYTLDHEGGGLEQSTGVAWI
jgi:hypothetical protein